MAQRDSTLLTSGPFSLGSNDPLLVGYGTTTTTCTTTSHTRKSALLPKTKTNGAPPPVTLLTPLRTPPKTTAMKRVKSLDFYALQHGSSSLMSREKAASRFSSSQEWRRFKAAPQGGPHSRSLNDALVGCQEEEEDEYFAKDYSTSSDSIVSRMNARRFPLFASLVMLFVVSWSHAAAGSNSSNSHGGGGGGMISKQHHHHHGGGALASAALSSITSTLSPILPFTGGIDLRRRVKKEEESWLDSIKSMIVQVQMAFFQTNHHDDNDEENAAVLEQIPRGGGGTTTTTPTMVKQQQQQQQQQGHVVPTSIIISHPTKPFVSQNEIAELTLDDITFLFKYAMNPNSEKVVDETMKPITAKLNALVHKSRGSFTTRWEEHDANASAITATTTGSMDALYFCAILRLFAEWRIVRQVPPGYKGYAVGMNLGHKDVVQNLAKLETAIHHYMAVHPHTNNSPTLRQLLEFEISLGTHGDKLPRLQEKSAAMGLLWVRRQLHYQTRVFDNILKVPSSAYPTCQTAVAHAYTTVYGMYHGWAVQKIFQYSFQAAPQVTEIYKSMNPTLLRDVTCKARRMMMIQRQGGESSSTLDDFHNDTTNHKDKSNNNPIERWIHHMGGEWNKLSQHIGGEWNKLVDNVVRVFDQDVSKPKEEDADAATRVRGGGSTSSSSLDEYYSEEMEQFISQQMEQDAHQRIARYLKQVEPLLEDLAGLFHDLNMDDPSKV
eukprot:CAMPEP_0202493874 /NCGR_PEP_ID=MMETSP1361-20130828/10038_1 /ASSEMBLY_ACC=CAM_ASM_000849 /TAXON_ID=210615 /ORGANISM="Staurosira complex sp., Strain CCMP2646" /LENGTH=719 /DNA_ID=CAMNT_0049124235 /DNA_START=60 /DNA_END=2219 /DNA_ORIENTATION=+